MRPEVEKALVAARDSRGVGVAVHQSEGVVAELAKKAKRDKLATNVPAFSVSFRPTIHVYARITAM